MLICLIRTVILYMLLICVIRLMGKRQLGEMEPSEFVVALLISDLASVPMQDLGIPLLYGVIPILTVLGLELLLSILTFHSIFLRKLFCGKPVILIEKGKILPDRLRETRITPDELTEQLREKGVVDLTTVRYAILETNGQISVLVDPAAQPVTAKHCGIDTTPLELPVTLISCGKVMKENLKLSGRSEQWLQDLLKHEQCTTRDILLLTVEPSGTLYLIKSRETT